MIDMLVYINHWPKVQAVWWSRRRRRFIYRNANTELGSREREIHSLRRQIDSTRQELNETIRERDNTIRENRRLQEDLVTMTKENQVRGVAFISLKLNSVYLNLSQPYDVTLYQSHSTSHVLSCHVQPKLDSGHFCSFMALSIFHIMMV